MFINGRMVDHVKIVTGLAPIAPSTSTPDYVSLKGYDGCLVVIMTDNAATVTGSAITLKQATAVAGTSEKALAFDTVWANTDVGAADTLVETAVTSNTFTVTNTDNKNSLYVCDVKSSDLDIANSFDCLRAGTANAVKARFARSSFSRTLRSSRISAASSGPRRRTGSRSCS